MKSLGEKIKIARESAKINRSDFAKKLGVSKPYLSQLENNHRNPGRDKLILAARITGVPLEFFTEDGVQTSAHDQLTVFYSDIKDAIDAGAKEEEIREAIRLITKIKKRAN